MSDIPHPREIAQAALEIIPFIMRVMSAEIRSGGHDLSAGNMGLLGQLNEAPATLGHLATVNRVSAPTMSNTVTVLEERGLVRRVRDTEDRRIVRVEITDAGRKLLKDIDRYTAERISEFLEPLTDDERVTLLSGLRLLSQTFAKAMGSYRPMERIGHGSISEDQDEA
ncbi:MAG: MarR family transcriptional regulator [Chloroflexi bacterium]|nr:MarR family transcriptional regulator [Chloroflexota bacterium]